MKNIIKKHIKSFIIAAILVLICNILGVTHPYIIKKVVDIDFSQNNYINTIITLFIAYLTVHLLFAIMKNIRNIQNNKLMANILKDIREKVFCKVLKFNMTTFNKYNSSEIYTRLTTDTANLFDLFFGFIQIIVNNITYIIFMVAMMFIANVNLALIGGATIAIVGIVSFGFTKKLKKLDSQVLDKRDIENREFSEMHNKHKLTYLFGLQQKNISKINNMLDEELSLRKKYISIHTLSYPVMLVLEACGIFLVLNYALNINTNIPLGDIYLILFYIKQCRSPLSEIFDRLEEMQTCLNSLKRINKLLKEENEEDIEKGEYIDNLNGDIEFENVSMRYTEEEVLKNISFAIKKGEKVAIAGKTGAGKTTLTNILMRLYDITSGQIRVNGKDISKINIKSLRNNISYISQNPYIFEDTLRNNIILGNINISDAEILEIIQKLEATSIYNRFEKRIRPKNKSKRVINTENYS